MYIYNRECNENKLITVEKQPTDLDNYVKSESKTPISSNKSSNVRLHDVEYKNLKKKHLYRQEMKKCW
jgi:hypothetical protein